MLRWLVWLKQNVGEYGSIEIDMEALSKIPEHGDITSLAPTLLESTVPSDPKSQATEDAPNNDNNNNLPEQEMGSMQGGASGCPLGKKCTKKSIWRNL
jgi:hypothetical protein